MRTESQLQPLNPKLDRIATVLRIAGWAGLWVQFALGAAAALMLVFAISGRIFNRTLVSAPGVGALDAEGELTPGITPGLGVGIFWATCGILVLLFTIYLAFRQTRFAKRLRHPNPAIHPRREEVLKLLRVGVVAGLAGMLTVVIGGGATLSILLAKSIAQPQGVAIYDPSLIIRSLDILVAMANMNGIAAHFVGTATSLGLFNWLHRP